MIPSPSPTSRLTGARACQRSADRQTAWRRCCAGWALSEISVVDGAHGRVHDPNLPMNVIMLQFTAVRGK